MNIYSNLDHIITSFGINNKCSGEIIMENFATVLAFGAVVVFLAFIVKKVKDSQDRKENSTGGSRPPRPPKNVDEIEP